MFNLQKKDCFEHWAAFTQGETVGKHFNLEMTWQNPFTRFFGLRLIHQQQVAQLMYDRASAAEASFRISPAFFHVPKLQWIQFKCKATGRTRYLCTPFTACLPEQLSTSGRLGWGPSLGPVDHSVGSDWLLDPLGVDLMRMDHPFCSGLSFQYSLAFFSLLLSFSVI